MPGPSLCPAPNTDTAPLLTWRKAQETVPWNIILLLGGGFAMAKGCEVRAAGLLPGRVSPLLPSQEQGTEWALQAQPVSCWTKGAVTVPASWAHAQQPVLQRGRKEVRCRASRSSGGRGRALSQLQGPVRAEEEPRVLQHAFHSLNSWGLPMIL